MARMRPLETAVPWKSSATERHGSVVSVTMMTEGHMLPGRNLRVGRNEKQVRTRQHWDIKLATTFNTLRDDLRPRGLPGTQQYTPWTRQGAHSAGQSNKVVPNPNEDLESTLSIQSHGYGECKPSAQPWRTTTNTTGTTRSCRRL